MAIWQSWFRTATRMISSGLSRIGQTFSNIYSRITGMGIKYPEPTMSMDIRSSIVDVLGSGVWGATKPNERPSHMLMVNTQLKAAWNYRTLLSVDAFDPERNMLIKKYVSVYHDKNYTLNELEKLVSGDYLTESEGYQLQLRGVSRELVWHNIDGNY